MANNDIRAPQVRLKGKKVADANDYQLEIDPNDELQPGADGIVGATVGIVQTTITLKGVAPVRGLSVRIDLWAINHTRVDAEYVSAGVVYSLKQAMVGKVSLAGKTENGENTYDVTVSGGQPDVIG